MVINLALYQQNTQASIKFLPSAFSAAKALKIHIIKLLHFTFSLESLQHQQRKIIQFKDTHETNNNCRAIVDSMINLPTLESQTENSPQSIDDKHICQH